MPRFPAIELLLLVAAAWCGAAEDRLKPQFSQAHAGELLTWEVRDPEGGWLSDDVTFTPSLEISGPDNLRWVRKCYLTQEHRPNPDTATGAAEWVPAEARPGLRVRHTPRVPGPHRWVLRSPDGRELAQGTLTVAAGSGPSGPLRVGGPNPRLLSFADGTPFIAIGPNLAWAVAPDRLGKMGAWFAKLKAQGGTHARVWFASWMGGIEGGPGGTLRQDQAWVMDRVLALARENGIRLTLALDNHHDLLTGKGLTHYGSSPAERLDRFLCPDPVPPPYKRRLAYIMARWGADDTVAVWELFNELDMAQPVRERCLPWAAAAARLLGELDQDRRPHAISWVGDDWERIMAVPGIDLVQLRGYVLEWVDPLGLVKERTRDAVGFMAAHADRANALGKPFCFTETGYQGTNEINPGNDLDSEGLLLRQQLWSGFLLGGYGTAMNWWWDVYLDSRDLWPAYGAFAKTVRRLDWRDKDLVPITPNPEGPVRIIGWTGRNQALLWPQLRLDTWHRLLVEKRPRPALGQPLPVRVGGFKSRGRYLLHRIDMRSGDEIGVAVPLASDAGGRLPLGIPAGANDEVLWIETQK